MVYKVQLHVYDLSRGMAKNFSIPLLGKKIDGIWHTAIVVYDIEYYFGGGILKSKPFGTPHGQPVEIIELGETEITKDLFEDFLNGQTDRFRMDTYHLLENNCNHFTNECSNFLLGVGIPSHISDLPAEFLNTSFGQMMAPMINNFFGQNNWGNSMGGPVNRQQQQQLPAFQQPLSNSSNITTSSSSTTTTTSTTTKTTTTTTTTNYQLHPKSKLGHKHISLVNKIPLILNNKPVLFEKSDIEAVFTKLKSFAIDEFKEQQQVLIKEFDEKSQKLKEIIKSTSIDIPVDIELLKYLEKLLTTFSEAHQFPLLEILRMLLLKNQSNQYFTNLSNKTISNLIKSIQSKKLSKASELLSYRVINNCFSSKTGINYLFNELNEVVECTIDGLHSMDKILKRAVCTLSYNISIYLTSDDKYSEQSLSLLTTLHHVLSNETELSSDSEIDFRLLMALGTLLYCCNDDLIDILDTLDFNFNKYLKSNESKIVQLTNEIKLLISK